MKNKLLEFVMSSMCDDYCRYVLDPDFSEDDLSEKCSKCPLALFMVLLDK